METLRKLGIPMVRRMSGGGTVYHDLGNVNYKKVGSCLCCFLVKGQIRAVFACSPCR